MKNEESKPSFLASGTTTTQVENPNISPGNNKSSVPLPQSPSEKDLINVNEDKTFPPGYRFCPTDYELVMDYLKLKVLNEPLPWNKMVDVDLYSECPEILTENFPQNGENEWYFFTPRARKYRNGNRPNRAAGDGYWKGIEAERAIISDEEVVVGFGKTLVFYRGKAPKGDKTNWIMHEYRVNDPPLDKSSDDDMRLDKWVLCRIYKKVEGKSSETQNEDEACSKPLPDDDKKMPKELVDPSNAYTNLSYQQNGHALANMVSNIDESLFIHQWQLWNNPQFQAAANGNYGINHQFQAAANDNYETNPQFQVAVNGNYGTNPQFQSVNPQFQASANGNYGTIPQFQATNPQFQAANGNYGTTPLFQASNFGTTLKMVQGDNYGTSIHNVELPSYTPHLYDLATFLLSESSENMHMASNVSPNEPSGLYQENQDTSNLDQAFGSISDSEFGYFSYEEIDDSVPNKQAKASRG
uniref:NAC domain-containing protein n=1 Tax=Fagus sylvatica TaxID=28930 RepID=A0A2N9GNL6_FAGSY